jgi:hypothetical protein
LWEENNESRELREERRSFGLVMLDLERGLEMLGDSDGKEPGGGSG